MEILLLGIYSAFVWLIFIKLKWLPWNTTSQVTVAIIPIVGLTALILTLNVVAPSSADVRVYKYTIPVVSQVRGRVLELCAQLGIAAVLRSVSPHELRAAEEVFLTSSLRGVLAVTSLDGEPRRRGPVTAKIADAYAACMRGASTL